MDLTVEQRAPLVRCYECGSSHVSALCHHCWRPGCVKHVVPSPRWAEKAFGREGSGPGLENVRACHCGDCAHANVRAAWTKDRWLALGVASAGLAAVGFIVVWLEPVIGLVLLLAGGISGAWACLHLRRRTARIRAGMPVPLHPKVTDVRLAEHLRGTITLGPQGDYKTVLEPVEGKISMLLTFGRPDQDRMSRRGKRTRESNGKIRFSAGRLVLKGQFGIKAGEQVPGPIIALDGEAGDYPVFRAEHAPSSGQWKFEQRYELRAEPDISSGPFWITPSIVPESDRHALELDVQWVEFGPDEDKPLSLDLIDLLRLEFPVSWGHMQSWATYQPLSTWPRPVGQPLPDGRRAIEWKQLIPADQAGSAEPREGPAPIEGEPAARAEVTGRTWRQAGRLTLAIRFEGQIDPGDEISGRLEATMDGTLSGVEGVQLFTSLGKRRGYGGKPSIKTCIEADFTLSLASIQYQAIRVVPDRAAEDSDRDKYADSFAVIPGDETVIDLTNAMSKERYYVKHVIENPPRSGARADLVQRYWDIEGRRYAGVYPIDFHIILTGEEVHSGDIRPERGTTKVRIVVKGAYTDDDMAARIYDEWVALRDLTAKTLGHPDSAMGEPG
jgi:hypothetical protein